MRRIRISTRPTVGNIATWSAGVALIVGAFIFASAPQARGAMQQPGHAAPPKPFPLTLTIADGTTANYRVREQLVGINFPNDAVGTSTAVTGTIAFNKDGSIDSSQSKLVFDLRTLKSDQSMRDGFIQGRTLQTSQYPNAVFVAKTIKGMPNPLAGQFGFELSGDMTIHGTTAPLTWQGIATVDERGGTVSGRVATGFPFEKFGMSPPKIFRVMSVNDSITLEVAFHMKIS